MHFTNSYNNNKTLDWISKLDPDIIVVHSNGWVGKSIRNTPKVGLIIGGHPGLTQFYRGAYPAFWAIYNREPEKIDYSIFHIDSGVDTGDLIFQKKINISENDSYMSIDWKGMKEIAKKQVEIIEEYEETEKILEKYDRLKQRRNQPAKVLSGGERRLLEISRALVMKPNVLLVDEPSIGLEPKYIDMVFEILRDLQQNEKKTIILVEQNAKKGLEFADIGYVLVSGQTAIAGKGNDLLNNPDVGRLFLGG